MTDTRTALDRLLQAWDRYSEAPSGIGFGLVDQAAFAARAAQAEPAAYPVSINTTTYTGPWPPPDPVDAWLRSDEAVEALEAAHEQHALNEESYHTCGTTCMTALRDALLTGREGDHD